ncbi:hypothetical protein [Streptomyces scabichelini]|uniref:hypothetical protein n=1 Tax=Streptomyces scabichelini TaxID=2711217 RepID=UPI001F495A97|nr:hypothetical protein [Streptomyces scabichelini]
MPATASGASPPSASPPPRSLRTFSTATPSPLKDAAAQFGRIDVLEYSPVGASTPPC